MAETPESTGQAVKPRVVLDIAELKRLRKDGLSLKAIGKELGVSAMTVRRQLQSNGEDTSQSEATRRRVAQIASRKRWGNPEETKSDEILRIWKQSPDLPCRLIAKAAGASYSWTWNVLTSAEVEIAPDKYGRKPPEEETE